jgi:hypothetical protein
VGFFTSPSFRSAITHRESMSVLYEHPSPLSLLPLLRRHLPHSLPAVSTLLTPGKPSKVYTTFPPAELVSFEQAGDEPWVVLIDSGNQYRFYCNSSSPESGAAQNDSGATEQDQASGRLLEKVIKEMMERASREKAEGAICYFPISLLLDGLR